MFNFPPHFGLQISAAFQVCCLLICGPLLGRLFWFYNYAFKEEGKGAPGLVRPALSLAYACLATVLVLANIWFLPQFSSSVLTVLPVLSESKRYFVYVTHSVVISAFIINYTNSVETLQELEHGRYGGTDEWGKMLAASRPIVQWLDTIARLLIGASFVWLESNLWRTGKIDLASMTYDFAVPDTVDIPTYRGMLADVADSAFGVYVSLTVWFSITLLVILRSEVSYFGSPAALKAIGRQVRIILAGSGISLYTLYIARGHLALFERQARSGQLDNDWIFAFALAASVLGIGLVREVVSRLLALLPKGRWWKKSVRTSVGDGGNKGERSHPKAEDVP